MEEKERKRYFVENQCDGPIIKMEVCLLYARRNSKQVSSLEFSHELLQVLRRFGVVLPDTLLVAPPLFNIFGTGRETMIMICRCFRYRSLGFLG